MKPILNVIWWTLARIFAIAAGGCVVGVIKGPDEVAFGILGIFMVIGAYVCFKEVTTW